MKDPSTDSEVNEAFRRYLRRPNKRRLARVVRLLYDEVWKVALRVTGHEEDAADVSQDVFLALLLSPPSIGSVQSARGYLVYRVLTLAARRARSAQRRRKREIAVARVAGEELTAPDREALREAMQTLPPRVRAVVELHYLAGYTHREIAELTGVSERTVALDLQKGREELRVRLGESASALLPILAIRDARPAPETHVEKLLKIASSGSALSPVASTTLLGGLVMKKVLICASCLALLTVLGITVVQFSSDGKRPDRTGPANRTGVVREPLAESEVLTREPTEVPGSSASQEPPESKLPRLSGYVVDADQSPVEGAWVGLFESERSFVQGQYTFVGFSSGTGRPWATEFDERQVVGKTLMDETHSDSEGRFEFNSRATTFDLRSVGPLRRTIASVGPVRGGDREVVLQLRPFRLLTGRVVDSETSAPVPSARVFLEGEEYRQRRETNGFGRFRFEHLQTGTHRLKVFHGRYNRSHSSVMEISEDAKDLLVEMVNSAEGVRVHGRITAAETGEGIEGAEISIHGEYSTFSDSDGSYNLRGPIWQDSQSVGVRVYAEGHERDGTLFTKQEEAYEWNVVLRRALSLRCSVVNKEGAPVHGAKVALVEVPDRKFVNLYGTTDTQGVCVFTGLHSGFNVSLFGFHPDFGRSTKRDFGLREDGVNHCVLKLRRGRADVAVYVSRGDGSPASNAVVLLRDNLPGEEDLFEGPLNGAEGVRVVTDRASFPVLGASRRVFADFRASRAGADGKAVFPGTFEGVCVVQALDERVSVETLRASVKENLPRSEIRQIEVSAGETPTVCELQLERAFTVDGKTMTSNSEPIFGLIVMLYAREDRNEWVVRKVCAGSVDGNYRFEALDPQLSYAVGLQRSRRLPERSRKAMAGLKFIPMNMSFKDGSAPTVGELDWFSEVSRDPGQDEVVMDIVLDE